MKVDKKELGQSQIELNIELSLDEFKPYIEQGVKEIAKNVKIDGFRDGNAPADLVMQKAGEMNVLDHSARIAINKTLEKATIDNTERQVIGNPKIDVTMLSPGNPLKYKVIFSYLPDVELGSYKDNNIKLAKIEIEKATIDKYIEALREQKISEALVDRKSKDSDKVMIDINMLIDKVPIEGGQSKGTSVIIGKDYLVKGFDEKLIGSKKGDELNFVLKFPKDHHDKKFADKDVEFEIKVNDVYERKLPEMNDDFFKGFGVKDLIELKAIIEENMKGEKKREVEQKADSEIVNKIVENSKISEIPEILIIEETRKMMAEIEQDITSKGGKLDDYLNSVKKTKEEFEKEMKPNAISRVKGALVMREIGVKEKVEVNEEDIDNKKNELLEQHKGYQKVEDRINEPGYRTYLHNLLVNNKIMEKLRVWNIGSKEKNTAEKSKVKK